MATELQGVGGQPIVGLTAGSNGYLQRIHSLYKYLTAKGNYEWHLTKAAGKDGEKLS